MGIVTILSDLGNADNAVAIAKGLLLKHNPDIRLIDVTHEILPYNLVQCSYLLKNSAKHYPKNSIHLSLFDVMNNSPAQVLFTQVDGQFFITSDNGLLPMCFENEEQIIRSWEIREESNFVQWVDSASRLIAQLQENDYIIADELAPTMQPKIEHRNLKPIVRDGHIEVHILHIDRFGNLVLNLTREEFEAHRNKRKFRIKIPGQVADVTSLCTAYDEVSQGTIFCIFNSSNYLELCVQKSSARNLLGLNIFEEGRMVYSMITVSFF